MKPIDLIQHQKFQEKLNPFHGRFTHKTAIFWFAKLKKEQLLLLVRSKFENFFRNKVVLNVKQISYFLHFSLLYVVYNTLSKRFSTKKKIIKICLSLQSGEDFQTPEFPKSLI